MFCSYFSYVVDLMKALHPCFEYMQLNVGKQVLSAVQFVFITFNIYHTTHSTLLINITFIQYLLSVVVNVIILDSTLTSG